jgi:hypothetical protein
MTKKNLFALVLAGSLMVPHITPAFGNDSTVGMSGARTSFSAQPNWDGVKLPAIPHLETLPWLERGSSAPRTRVDLLWQPRVNTPGPFWLQPTIPTATFSLSQASTGLWTE